MEPGNETQLSHSPCSGHNIVKFERISISVERLRCVYLAVCGRECIFCKKTTLSLATVTLYDLKYMYNI